MKLIKNFCLMLMSVMLTASLFSCSSSDDEPVNPENALVGTAWVGDYGTATYNGTTEVEDNLDVAIVWLTAEDFEMYTFENDYEVAVPGKYVYDAKTGSLTLRFNDDCDDIAGTFSISKNGAVTFNYAYMYNEEWTGETCKDFYHVVDPDEVPALVQKWKEDYAVLK